MKDFGMILVYSVALFIAVKFFWQWATGGFNNIAVWEWMSRGFSFGIGLAVAFMVVAMVLKLVSGD